MSGAAPIVRVPIQTAAARSIRLQRLHHHRAGSLMLAPVDHSISDGPIVNPIRSLDQLVADLVGGGIDGLIVHKGSLRHIRPERFLHVSLVVHLTASTGLSLEPDAKYLVTGVEEAIRIGADAVSVHVNLGSVQEAQQIADLAQVAEQCDRWNLPLLAMMYPRGPRIMDPRDPKVVAHAVTVAADLGADLVKTVYPGSVAGMDFVASRCSIPIVVAGGPRQGNDGEVLRLVMD
ncbi:MAG: 2-amino-3,7-dideoxy-D-threo-hept-6-ulosonate synthase, partial [Angustibacter sp.]